MPNAPTSSLSVLPPAASREVLWVAGQAVRVEYHRHPRARRYLLRLRADGAVRVTLPRRGTLEVARAFVAEQRAWVERQWCRFIARPAAVPTWRAGQAVYYRGNLERLALTPDAVGWRVHWADQVVFLPVPVQDLRPAVEERMRALARQELPMRVAELAATAGLTVRRVQVRDQRTRWGACSRRGTIALNWRLVQVPPAVRDYVIWHELMHLREMNHSQRFWRAVAEVCPDFEAARSWLRQHGRALR